MFPHSGQELAMRKVCIGSTHDTAAYTKSDSTGDSTRPWVESDVCDRNATIFFPKAYLSNLHDNKNEQICASVSLLKWSNYYNMPACRDRCAEGYCQDTQLEMLGKQ